MFSKTSARAILGALWLVACANQRQRTEPQRCVDYQASIQPLFDEACVACHGEVGAQGGYQLSSYRTALAPDSQGRFRVQAGAADSLLLKRAAGGDGHPAVKESELILLQRWVLDCDLSYFATGALHPLGYLNPRDPQFHGAELRASGWNFELCNQCHGVGDDPSGGLAQKSCLRCHEEGPTACNTCHGDSQSAAPPRALDGSVLNSTAAVGAHRLHLTDSKRSAAVSCNACHLVPVDWKDEGHIFLEDGSLDPSPAEVVFGALAQGDLAGRVSERQGPPAYDPTTKVCSNVYCHGSTLGDPNLADPRWTDSSTESCSVCHQVPPAENHFPEIDEDRCVECHGSVVTQDLSLQDKSLHIDGRSSLGDGSESCSACHGQGPRAAPPLDLDGERSSALLTVGAHRAHTEAFRYRGPIPCADCHEMPTGSTFLEQVRAPGHLDSDRPAELFPGGMSFQGLAATDNAQPNFDRGEATCEVYCHGGGDKLSLDSDPAIRRQPSWTSPAGPMLCGDCHGLPPQDGLLAHATASLATCFNCHGESIDEQGSLIFDEQGHSTHLDGKVLP